MKPIGNNWVFERSSGYAGYRCTHCAKWVYDTDPNPYCDCNVQAINLGIAIKHYVPKGWVGPIREFDFAPLIGIVEYHKAKDLYNRKQLDQFDKRWYVQAAVKDFFEKLPSASTPLKNTP